MKTLAGSTLIIPAATGFGLAKVIFESERYVNTIGIKLFQKRFRDRSQIEGADFQGGFDVYYTSGYGLTRGDWVIFGAEDVTDEERALTKRIIAGSLWVEDTHLGVATEDDYATVDRFIAKGYKLIEKYVGKFDLVET